MKKVLILIILLLMLSPILSCSSKDTSYSTGNKLENIPEWAAYLMQRTPGNVQNATFIDMAPLRSNPNLSYFYSLPTGLYNMSIVPKLIAGIDSIKNMEYCDRLAFFVGEFNLTQVRNNLTNAGWSRSEFEGWEIWSNEFSSIGLNAELVIYGINDQAVKDSILTSKGKQESLYYNTRFKELIKRLPADAVLVFYHENQDVDGSIVNKVSYIAAYTRSTEDEIGFAAVVMSDDNESAEAVASLIAEFLTSDPQQPDNFNWGDKKYTQDGACWIFTANLSEMQPK